MSLVSTSARNSGLGSSARPLAGPSRRWAGRAARRSAAPVGKWLGIAGAVALLAGCPASSEDVRPPADQIFFPSGLRVAPDESVMFVANNNSDLRYDSGTVAVIDLDRVDALVDAWLTTGAGPAGSACEVERSLAAVLECDETDSLIADAAVRTGNFATELGLQSLASGDLRLFVAVRGDPSVTWIDYNASARNLDCGGSGALPACADANRLSQLRDDLELPSISDEPFGVYVDSDNGYAMVTHLTAGTVTLIDSPSDGAPPLLADAIGGLFAPDPSTGARGAVGVAGRTPGDEDGLVYVTSRSEDRVQMLYVNRPANGLPRIVPSEHFFLNGVFPSDDSRGIAFDESGDRAFLVNREPPMLQVLDTSLGADGFPRNEMTRAVEICRNAANLAYVAGPRGERVYVSCFSTGEVWVIDPEAGRVESIIEVGRGPFALAAAPGRERLYVANFLEDTIAVIDLTGGAITQNRVVLRLGIPRQRGDAS